MRIGILTFHCAHNYGAMLQCYALQEYLKGRGDEVYVIDYRPDYLVSPNRKHQLAHWLSKSPLRTLNRLLSEPFYIKKEVSVGMDSITLCGRSSTCIPAI